MKDSKNISINFYNSIYNDLEKSAGGEIRTHYILSDYKLRSDIIANESNPNDFFSKKFLKRHRAFVKIFMVFGFFLDTVHFIGNNKNNRKLNYCGSCYLWDIIPALLSKFIFGIEVACVSHDSPLQLNYYYFLKNQEKIKFPKIIISYAVLRLQSFLMRFTDLPISISETDTLYLKKLGLGDKIILSSNGIPKRNSILKTVVERKYDIVYVGRIIDRKNIPLILRIFRELRDYSYSVKMLIITNTENDKMSFVYDFIRQWKLEDNIHVIKDATEDLKFDLLGDSKISINLSRDETFSISTMESAYMGNALLLSNETFFKSIYGEAAIYVDPAEISNTVNIILKILNDNTMLEQRMRMSRALAERYTYDQTVDSEIEQIVSKLSDRV